jgi:hypothetical protein
LQALTSTYDAAVRLDDPVKECVHFEFLKPEKLKELVERESELSAKYFWTQLAQLLAFVARTVPAAVTRLTDGIIVAVSTKNELLLALSIRAWQEQISVLFVLTEELKANHDRLIEVWKTISDGGPRPMEPDYKLRKLLIRYSLGRRIESSTLAAPHLSDGTKIEWETFNKRMQMNKADEVFLQSVMNSIDEVSKLERTRFWRSVYEELCEYCHPNSLSRSMGFAQRIGRTGNYSFSVQNAELSTAFQRVFHFGKHIMPAGSDLVLDSFKCVAASLRPMPPLDDSLRIPTINSIASVDVFGRNRFVPVDAISIESSLKPAELTDDQLNRIRRLVNVLGDTDEMPFEDWVYNISIEPDPEEELQIAEACEIAFTDELEMRSDFGKEGRKLLWNAINGSTMHESVDNLLSAQPQFKGLSKLDGVFRRVQKCLAERKAKG